MQANKRSSDGPTPPSKKARTDKAKINTILIGNPGVGKSTFLNGLLNEQRFTSGISLGKGLTSVCQQETDSHGNVYIDTPGLSDISLRKQAAAEIKTALQNGGLFKIFFVITLEEGRIRPDDKTTMKLVLNCAPIGHFYSVIINKLQPEVLELFQDDAQKADFITLLNEDLPGASSVFFNPFCSGLSAKKNIIPGLSDAFYKFLAESPMLLIEADQVQDIASDQFEELKELLGKQLTALQEDNEQLKLAMMQQREKYDLMIKEAQQHQEKLAEGFAVQIDKMHQHYAEQQKEQQAAREQARKDTARQAKEQQQMLAKAQRDMELARTQQEQREAQHRLDLARAENQAAAAAAASMMANAQRGSGGLIADITDGIIAAATDIWKWFKAS